jgi:hypothetical protein
MAIEAGGDLSGMEFTRQYAPSPAFGTVTRGRMLSFATYTTEDGSVLNSGGFSRDPDMLPCALLNAPVYAVLDKAETPEQQEVDEADLIRSGDLGGWRKIIGWSPGATPIAKTDTTPLLDRQQNDLIRRATVGL